MTLIVHKRLGGAGGAVEDNLDDIQREYHSMDPDYADNM